jgi:hypothetical protein
MRKNTLRGAIGADGGARGIGGATTAEASSSPSSLARVSASAASFWARDFASCSALVFSSGKIAGCLIVKDNLKCQSLVMCVSKQSGSLVWAEVIDPSCTSMGNRRGGTW